VEDAEGPGGDTIGEMAVTEAKTAGEIGYLVDEAFGETVEVEDTDETTECTLT